MLGQVELLPALPLDTQRAARKEFLIENPYLKIGDSFERIFEYIDLEKFNHLGNYRRDRSCRLALITAFQFAESLPDETAAYNSHSRLDWKYALHVPLQHPGIRSIDLCRFRLASLSLQEGEQEFRKLLDFMWEEGLFENRECWQSSHQVGLRLVCNITRLDYLMKAMSIMLESLAVNQPNWLKGKMLPHWYERYSATSEEKTFPCQIEIQRILALEIGNDIHYLLDELDKQLDFDSESIPDASNLRRIWNEQYRQAQGGFYWREGGCSYCSLHGL